MTNLGFISELISSKGKCSLLKLTGREMEKQHGYKEKRVE